MKRLIIFDFFGVIGGEISPRWFSNHFEESEAKILKDKYFEPADLGVNSIYDVISMLSKDYGFKEIEIVEEWKSYVKVNEELLEVIKKLREKNNVALLSNAAEGIFELLYPLDFDKIFDKAFISYKYKIKKPDLNFYKLLIESFNDEFDEVYMIDDNLGNLNNLNELGIIPIQYTDNDSLFKLLNKFM